MCALIHKVRPKDVPWNELNKDTANRNLNLAMDLAEKWFGLERYISPEDIPKLDENRYLFRKKNFSFQFILTITIQYDDVSYRLLHWFI